MKEKLTKKRNVQKKLAIALIIMQILAIISNVTIDGGGSKISEMSVFELLGFFLMGIVGTITLLIQNRKDSNK